MPTSRRILVGTPSSLAALHICKSIMRKMNCDSGWSLRQTFETFPLLLLETSYSRILSLSNAWIVFIWTLNICLQKRGFSWKLFLKDFETSCTFICISLVVRNYKTIPIASDGSSDFAQKISFYDGIFEFADPTITFLLGLKFSLSYCDLDDSSSSITWSWPSLLQI